jgi:hypothetical protein
MPMKGQPAMWMIPALQIQANSGDPNEPHAARLSPAPARHRQNGRTIMRQMLIAATIAAGLVALWAALLPLAA